MSIRCSQAEDLLGAYALDALSEEEARRMDEHLASCPEHAAAAADLRWTQSRLALTVDEGQPSPELRARIMTAIEREPLASGPPPEPSPHGGGRTAQYRRWAPRWQPLAVAAALLLSLGIGGLIGYRLNQTTQPIVYNFPGDPSRAPGAEARLVYFKDRQQALLAATGLPRLTAGHVYEMWLIRSGVPVDEGIGTASDGRLTAQIAADLGHFDVLAITIEPGEQALPTTTPILIGQLRSS
jgi:anti-sigma-K factor RskA